MRRWGPPIAAAVVAAIVVPTPATGEPEVTQVDLRIAYTCAPAGQTAGGVPVEVAVTAELPMTGTVTEPIQPSSVAIGLTMPPPDLPAAASVTVLARLDTTITQRATATATWSGALSEPVPVADPLVLDIPVDTPPPVVATTPGEVAFAVDTLTVELAGYQADGTATAPPSTQLTCTPDPDQATRFAVVTVVDSAAPPPITMRPAPPGAVVVDQEPATQEAPDTRAVEIPADCEIIDPPVAEGYPPAGQRYCAYVTGYVNVARLGGSVLQPHGIVNIAPTGYNRTCIPGMPTVWCQKANVLANLDGEPNLPESTGSFHAFGFVPVKAKMQLTQVDMALADIRLHVTPPFDKRGADIEGDYHARIFEATVNGVPLELGPNCRTVVPVHVKLTAGMDYTLTGGGLFTGKVKIPPFGGCGVTENLDRIITGLISTLRPNDPLNDVRLTQGPICTIPASPRYCPPEKPDPQ